MPVMTEAEVHEACDRMERLIDRATMAAKAERWAVVNSLMEEVYRIAKTLPVKQGQIH